MFYVSCCEGRLVYAATQKYLQTYRFNVGPVFKFHERHTEFIIVNMFSKFCTWRCCRGTPLPNIVRVVKSKSRRMRWAGHVARMGKGEGCTGFWWGNLREREHWGDPDVDGRIILRCIFRMWEGVARTGWSWLRIGTGGGHL